MLVLGTAHSPVRLPQPPPAHPSALSGLSRTSCATRSAWLVLVLGFLVARCGVQLGGDERVRTAGLLRAKQALSQLSYTPAGVESPFE